MGGFQCTTYKGFQQHFATRRKGSSEKKYDKWTSLKQSINGDFVVYLNSVELLSVSPHNLLTINYPYKEHGAHGATVRLKKLTGLNISNNKQRHRNKDTWVRITLGSYERRQLRPGDWRERIEDVPYYPGYQFQISEDGTILNLLNGRTDQTIRLTTTAITHVKRATNTLRRLIITASKMGAFDELIEIKRGRYWSGSAQLVRKPVSQINFADPTMDDAEVLFVSGIRASNWPPTWMAREEQHEYLRKNAIELGMKMARDHLYASIEGAREKVAA